MKVIPFQILLFLSLLSYEISAQSKALLKDHIVLKGEIGESEQLAVQRMFHVPFTSLSWLRADLTNETVTKEDNNWSSIWNRPFKNYSGDISGRYLELMSILSGGNIDYHPALRQFIMELPGLQQPDGHFGWAKINWNDPIDFAANSPQMMPALWGNGRILCGLVEATKAFGDQKLLQSAKRLGDFYITVADRFMDTKKMKEYKTGDTYAAAYVTCYFHAMEGLVKLYQITNERKYLELTERMAAFYDSFDVLPIEHTHGMLCNQYALLLLYEQTGNEQYLKRVESRWDTMVKMGYVNPAGGVLEGTQIGNPRDEGCAETDWLRVNLKLSEITGNKRYLDMAERLLWNHFLANQNSSGGFGCRFIISDKEGAFCFSGYDTEATWCCDFHGALGFQIIKPFLVTVQNQEIRISFPLSFNSTINCGERVWNIQSFVEPGKSEGVVLQQTIWLSGEKENPVRLSLRLPDWSKGFTATDALGKVIDFEPKQGYWQSKESLRPKEKVTVYYKGGIVIENRNCQTLSVPVKEGCAGKVVLRYGPKLLSLKDHSTIPILLLGVDSNNKVVMADRMIRSRILEHHTTIQTVSMLPREERKDSVKSVFVFDAILHKEIQNKQ